MKRRFWTTYLVLALLAGSCLPLFAQGSRASAPRPRAQEGDWQPKPVTLDLKGVPLNEAIEQIIASTDLPVIRVGDIPAEPRVTMILRESNPVDVLRLLSASSDLRFDISHYGGPPPPVALLAVSTAPPGWVPRGASQTPKTVSESAPTAPHKPALAWNIVMPGASTVTIDLDVSDTPFRNAVAEIVKQIPENVRTDIVVDDSVPEDLRVTARVRKMDLTWILDSIVGQAGLTYGVRFERTEDAGQPGVTVTGVRTVYIVPKPELKVSAGSK